MGKRRRIHLCMWYWCYFLVIAGFKLGKLDEEVEVHLPGGELLIIVYEIGEEVRIFMEGEAILVFDGVMELDI